MHVSLTAVPYKQLESFSKQYLILCNGTCNSEFKHCILKIANEKWYCSTCTVKGKKSDNWICSSIEESVIKV